MANPEPVDESRIQKESAVSALHRLSKQYEGTRVVHIANKTFGTILIYNKDLKIKAYSYVLPHIKCILVIQEINHKPYYVICDHLKCISFSGELSLIAIGPLTNIATAIRTDPTFGSRLKQCHIMGGNYHGNSCYHYTYSKE